MIEPSANPNKWIIVVVILAIIIYLGNILIRSPRQSRPDPVTSLHPAVSTTPEVTPQKSCSATADCQNGATCMTVGPIIAGQPVRKVCAPPGQAEPL